MVGWGGEEWGLLSNCGTVVWGPVNHKYLKIKLQLFSMFCSHACTVTFKMMPHHPMKTTRIIDSVDIKQHLCIMLKVGRFCYIWFIAQMYW